MNDFSGLPAFVFPVFAWAPEAAMGAPGDDGTREFRTPEAVVTTSISEAYYQGWTFVDSKGRCWEVAACRVTNPVTARLIQALSFWIRFPEFRLAFEFVERSPMTFDAVRNRLLEAIAANPTFYRHGYGRKRQRQLRAAERFSDLIEIE